MSATITHFRETLVITGGDFNVEPTGILECDVLLSSSRPASFELRLAIDPSATDLSDEQSTDLSDQSIAALPVPGAPIEARWGRSIAFGGIVESISIEDRAGEDPAVVLRACAAYHFLRSRPTDTVYQNVLLSELAWRLALEMGLKPCVECPQILLPEVRIEGDRLVLLRQLAKRNGLALAVESQCLHVRESLVGLGRTHLVTRADALVAFDVQHSCGGARGARVVASGIGRMRPLDTVEFRGFGRFRDGCYQVGSCLVSLEADGWRTELEMEEER